jgi:NADH dehydrogenase FAD-containing subunit
MPETRNIVFLGASYGGLSASHYVLRHVYPHLPNDANIKYKVILVDPSSKWFARHASPRAIARPDLAPLNQVFLDIEPGYKQYGDKVKFIQGKATGWDDKARLVTVQLADGSVDQIEYWALVLATGTKTSQLHSLQGNDYTEVETALKAVHSQIPAAKNVIVVGGGPSGVETAGELGDLLNGAAGFFSSRPSNPKAKITLITSSSKLLPQLRQSISDQAENYLNRVGVDVRYNTKLYAEQTQEDGKTKVTLHDGEELETDVVISTVGVQPMAEYVPERLKDAKGYV